MARLSHIVARSVTLAALAALAPAAAVAQTTTPSTPPSAPATLAATVGTCTTGLTPEERTAVFTGSMAQVKKSVTMAMRFELSERIGDAGPYAKLKLTGFSSWQRSEKNVAGFVYDKRVQQLEAPAAYRVTVRFRWYDARGRVVKTATRTSAPCRQPDLRPDLTVSQLTVGGTRPDGTALYTVTVRNAGKTATTASFTTGLTIDRIAQPLQTLQALAPDTSATLSFVGPRCVAGAAIVATIDVGQVVDEADEGDNLERKSCPGATGS